MAGADALGDLEALAVLTVVPLNLGVRKLKRGQAAVVHNHPLEGSSFRNTILLLLRLVEFADLLLRRFDLGTKVRRLHFHEFNFGLLVLASGKSLSARHR